MKEIGGYFEIEVNNNKEYHEALRLNTARNCFKYIIRSRKIRSIYLPDYLCPIISDVCVDEGIDIYTYCIGDDLKPSNLPNILRDDEYIYLINYFGILPNEYVVSIRNAYKSVILDNVQAFFSKAVEGVDTLYSCRKYFGVPDGAYLYTTKYSSEVYIQDSSIGRMEHLLGRFETDAQSYYTEYRKNEEILNNEEIKYMSKITQNLLRGFDYSNVKFKREANFSYLKKELSKYNSMILPQFIPGPFMYPLVISNGEKVRDRLLSEKVYVPILWPNNSSKWSELIIPIPCDQRYAVEDMARIVKLVKSVI